MSSMVIYLPDKYRAIPIQDVLESFFNVFFGVPEESSSPTILPLYFILNKCRKKGAFNGITNLKKGLDPIKNCYVTINLANVELKFENKLFKALQLCNVWSHTHIQWRTLSSLQLQETKSQESVYEQWKRVPHFVNTCFVLVTQVKDFSPDSPVIQLKTGFHPK